MILKFKAVGLHELPAPSRATDGAAGFDLMSATNITIPPHAQRIVPAGFAVAIPDGYVGLIRDRSGMAYKKRLTTRAGVIDSDYRGGIGIIMANESDEPIELLVGTRVAQMVVVPCFMGDSEEVEELPDTIRGDGGFGSTGE